MAGIIANAASAPVMTSGDTAVNNTRSNFVADQRVSLSTSPVGSSYTWELSVPTGSSAARSALSSTTDAAPKFTPDVAGEYLVRATVDGTEYSLRLTVANATVAAAVSGMRFTPVTDASVAPPATGVVVYYSSTQSALAVKNAAGVVSTVNLTPA